MTRHCNKQNNENKELPGDCLKLKCLDESQLERSSSVKFLVDCLTILICIIISCSASNF